MMVFVISGNVQAATLQIANNGRAFASGEVLTVFSDPLTLAPGEYSLDLKLKALVWQKGGDAHGWEPSDRIIVKAFLNNALFVEAVESGLDGQDKILDWSVSLDFEIEKKSQLEIDIFADASDKKERWRVLNADLNGAPLTAVPNPSALYLMVSGVVGLVGLRRTMGKKTS
jgi:hypothetical protein